MSFLAAQQEVPAATVIESPVEGASQDAAGPGDGTAEDVERARKLRLAILTGGLVAVTGLALVMLTILGGSATRRGLRRKPLIDRPSPPEAIPADRFDGPDAGAVEGGEDSGSSEGTGPDGDGGSP